MAKRKLRMVKAILEFCKRNEGSSVPRKIHGLYVLYKHRPISNKYDVVYIGMNKGPKSGIGGRLQDHNRSKKIWTHFSIFQINRKYRKFIFELEGILRHVYQKDSRANRLNKQKKLGKMKKIMVKTPIDLKP